MRCQDVHPVALVLQGRQPGLEVGEFAGARPESIEPVGLGPDADEASAQFGEARAGREEQLAEVALAGQDALATGLKRVVVEREHGPVGVAVDAAEFAGQKGFGDRLVPAVEQAVLRALDAHEVLRAAGEIERGADPHRRIGMQEVEPALRPDAEEEIEDGGQRGRLAGLVRPVDDVEIGLARLRRAEVDPMVGEPAEPGEVEMPEPHQDPAAPACNRASTSSEPAWTKRASVSPNAASFEPRRPRSSGGSWVLSSSAIRTTSAWKAPDGMMASSIRRRSSARGSDGEPAGAPGGRHSVSSFSTQHRPMSPARSSASIFSRSRSRRRRQASDVVPVKRSRVTRCSAATRPPGALEPQGQGRDEVSPFIDAGHVDGDPLELRDARGTLLDADRSVVADRRQRHRFGAGLVDVAALRHAGHDDRAPPPDLRAPVDMAERPIVETARHEIGRAAGRVQVVALGAGETGVQQADVHGALRPRPVFGHEALGRVRLGEAQAMDRHGEIAVCPVDRDGLGLSGEDLDRIGKAEFFGDARQGVVVAPDHEASNAGLVQPPDLLGQEPRRLHRGLLAVVEIPGQQQRVHLLGEAEIDDRHERAPGRVADQIGERRIAQRQRAQRRVEVDVGRVDEAIGHDPCPSPARCAAPPRRSASSILNSWSRRIGKTLSGCRPHIGGSR